MKQKIYNQISKKKTYMGTKASKEKEYQTKVISSSPSSSNTKPHQHHHVLPFITVFILTVVMAIQLEKHKIFLQDIKDCRFQTFLILVVGASILMYLKGDYRARTAVKQSIIALIIAYFAHLDMIFSTFFLVFVFAYYAKGWE